MDEVIGKALFVYWPFKDMQSLTGPDIVTASQ
jgi:hypothetical protein